MKPYGRDEVTFLMRREMEEGDNSLYLGNRTRLMLHS